MKIQLIEDLNNHFLIATPKVTGELFAQSVLYLYEHDQEGSMGFLINKPLPITLGDILRQLNVPISSDKADQVTIMQGGPVSPEQLYIIQYNDPNSPKKRLNTSLVQPQDLLKSFAAGEAMDNILPFLGYSGWEDKQLDDEIKRNDWLVCPANYNILFHTPTEERWAKSIDLLGIDLARLSNKAGQA